MTTVALDQDTLERMITDGLAQDLTAREMADRIATLLSDSKVGEAISHPLRQGIVRVLRERRQASPTEIAVSIDAPLGSVAYHVRKLHELGMIELVGTTPRRGAVEHLYSLPRPESSVLPPPADPPGRRDGL